MIHELRSSITFPNTSNLQMLTDQLNDLYGTDEVNFNIRLGTNDFANGIFINALSGTKIGYVFLDSGRIGIFPDYGDSAFCYELVEWLKINLPFSQMQGVIYLKSWLEQVVINTHQQMGLERMLSEMEIGNTKNLPVPFTNRYYSKKQNSKMFFTLNQGHLKKVIETDAMTELIQPGRHNEQSVGNLLGEAVFEGLDYIEFIESLNIQSEPLLQKLQTIDDPLSLQLQRAYYISRSQEDTAKAIYRLVSIGIIDNYTIDYQNKLYNISFTKKRNDEYYDSLEGLISRYTSRNIARREIEKLKKESKKEINDGEATIMSKCLEFLTDFIYGKIKEKRLQAIDDMIKLCKTSIKIKDPLSQNKFVKDEIYYYFNAKYSRVGYEESWLEPNRKGQLIEKTIGASMPDDLSDGLQLDKAIEKYIFLAENEETGEFISNIKHLRGSTMKMLRSHPDMPQYRILKSFALFILGETVKELVNDAKEELVRGLIDWKYNENRDLNVQEFILAFKARINNHINYDIEKAFDDIEDHYHALYYATWTGNFNKQFLLPQQ
jgi:hypothetical protein